MKTLNAGWIAAGTVLFAAGPSIAQIYEEIPGYRDFTGEMLVRPLQVEDWMRRGYTEQQSRERHRQTSEWLVNFLEHRFFNYSPFFDRYDFRLDANEDENEMGRFLIARDEFSYVCPNWRHTPNSSDCPDDEHLGDQPHHLRIESCAAWQIHTDGDDDIVIALCETGCRITHEDLSAYRQLAYSAETGTWEDAH